MKNIKLETLSYRQQFFYFILLLLSVLISIFLKFTNGKSTFKIIVYYCAFFKMLKIQEKNM